MVPVDLTKPPNQLQVFTLNHDGQLLYISACVKINNTEITFEIN